jgi:hypothetical protein
MDLGQRHGQVVSFPRIHQVRVVADNAFLPYADRFDVRVLDAPVAAVTRDWIAAQPVIEIPIARDVVVQADDIRWRPLGAKEVELVGPRAVLQ